MKALRYLIILLLINTPIHGLCSPPLPEEADFLFEGTFESDLDTQVYPIEGNIKFTLERQEKISKYMYLDWVTWDFSMNTFDSSIFLEGFLDNSEAAEYGAGYIPYDAELLEWGALWWDSFVDGTTDDFTGIDWDTGIGIPMGPDWNISNNLNYLPESIYFELFNWDTEDFAAVNINLTPVIDNCPSDPNKTEPGICGCDVPETDTDLDGTPDCIDNCPNDPNKTEDGICGCGIPDTDSDGDGIPDCNDDCDNSIDSDGDGVNDCDDLCPFDPYKMSPGVCGCGIDDSDSDGDGTLDCIDLCPYDPNKTVLGVCGCGVPDTDSDADGTPNCIDNCPNDPNKTMPGVCGCGILDTDSDGDGISDCNDNCNNLIDSDGDGLNDCDDLCPKDPNKTEPGTCGCGIADTDLDGDGTFDCIDLSDDGDGIPDREEQGPDGNNPNYDGNSDGLADSLQDNVASFHTFNYQNYITLETSVGTSISNCSARDNPSESNAPLDVEFSFGFFEFIIESVAFGSGTTAMLHFPVGESFNTYYKYGPTPDNASNHWYEFVYDGQTGALIDGNVVTLYFVDGMRGDDDLTANGTISDIGGPGITLDSGDSGDNGGPVVGGSGGGGGGCFISTALDGSVIN